MNRIVSEKQNIEERCYAAYERLTGTLIEQGLLISTMESGGGFCCHERGACHLQQ